MIPNLPLFISIAFIIATLYTSCFFIKSNNLTSKLLSVIVLWILVLSVFSYLGMYHYQAGDKFSRFVFILFPSIFFIIYLLRNKKYYENRNVKWSTALHVVRLPVELLLYELAIRKWLPIEMTFEGVNYDIIPGITAMLLVLWMQFKKVNKYVLLTWNVVSLCLVLFILTNGFLSQELLYEKFGYSVPNKAIAYFPMVLLAGVIVPMVIYTHVSDIILLLNRKPIKNKKNKFLAD